MLYKLTLILTIFVSFIFTPSAIAAHHLPKNHGHHITRQRHHHKSKHHMAHHAQVESVELCFEGEGGRSECAMYSPTEVAEIEARYATPDEEAELVGIEAKQRREERGEVSSQAA